MLKIFKKGFGGDYGMTMTAGKLRTLCEVDWPAFGVDWPSEGSLDRSLVAKVWHKVTCKPGHPDQFLHIDSWLQLILNCPQWLRGQAATVLMAKGQAVREKPHSTRRGMQTPKVLTDPPAEETLPMIPPPYQEEGVLAPGPETSAPPLKLHTPKPPGVDKKECRGTPPIATCLPGGTPPLAARLQPKAGVQMPLREQRYMGVDEDRHMVERCVFMYLSFTSADLINWKNNTPSYTEKPEALIDLLQTIVQTHNPTWADCHQLLMYLCNTDERWRVLQATSKWLEEHVPVDYQNPEYVRA
ncbi:Gag polyprotein [Plecturocebus cupreus]